MFFWITQKHSCEDLLGEIASVSYRFHHFCLYPIIMKQYVLVAQEPIKMYSSALVIVLWKVDYTKQYAGDRAVMPTAHYPSMLPSS